MIFAIVWRMSVHVAIFLRRMAPTNRLITYLRSPSRVQWGIVATLLAMPYLAIALAVDWATRHGGPGVLHLLSLLCIWNAVKFIANGIVSTGLILRQAIAGGRS